MSASPSLAIIILNWRRPQNIGRIVRVAAEAFPEAFIFVLDQAEAPNRLDGRDDIPWELCWRQSRANRGAGARVPLAAELPFDAYLCIDDDVFLTAAQMQALVFMLNKDPARAHGIWGQLVFRRPTGEHHLEDSITRVNCDASSLNMVYAFTRTQAKEAIVLASLVGYSDWDDVGFGDDMLISCAGSRPPRIHDLGPFERCQTAGAEGIAVYKSEGFREARLGLATRLLHLGRLHVEPSQQ